MKHSCEGIVSVGISPMFDMDSPCWMTGGIDRRRLLDTGPTISGVFGRDAIFVDPLMITMGLEYSRWYRFSCCSSKTSLDSVATVLIAASGPERVLSPGKTSLHKSHQNETNGISVWNTYYNEPVVWLVHKTGCLVSTPCHLPAGLPAATRIRVTMVE